MLRNTKVRFRILRGFGILLALMLLTTFFAVASFYRMQNTTDKVANNVIPLERTIANISTELANEESDVRGYIASNGDNRFLETYSTSRKNVESLFNEIKKYYSLAHQLELIVEYELIPNVEVINKHFDSQIELVKSGKADTARDRLADGKIHMDIFTHVKNKTKHEVTELSDEAIAEGEGNMSLVTVFMVINFLVCLAISLFIAIRLSNKIAVPLRRSIESLSEISKGNLSVPPLNINSKDETGELANAINTMQNSGKN